MRLIVFIGLILKIVFCDADIQVVVKTESEKDRVLVTFNGVDKKTVTDMEVKLFNITDYNLSRGVRIELGKASDDIFLYDPTKYGNLYKKYNWSPVTRKLEIRKTEIVDVINEDVVLKSHEYVNNTTNTIKTKASIYQTVENVINSFWSKEGLPEDNIIFKIDYNFTGGNKSYRNLWRKDNFRSASIAFGTVKKGYINIKPGQRITIRLSGKKTILLIKIYYVASLIGNVVLNYAHVYGKYHFWAPQIKDIMKAAGIINEVMTTELIEVRCHTDPVLYIFDSSSGEPVNVITPLPPFRFRPKSKQPVKSRQ
ncbi:spherulin-2A-like [Battus philenor]|uniref:spherulin-2A-like n=1 Tax=Battus philenor TaxID=42288 RepID=UPI0035CFD078